MLSNKQKIIICLMLLALLQKPNILIANPLPSANAEEFIYIDIHATTETVYANVYADYHMDAPDSTTLEILYPILENANVLSLQGDTDTSVRSNINWVWSSLRYPTVLPECSTIPIMSWQPPFPTFFVTYEYRRMMASIVYSHELIRRGDNWLFFYPMGVWKLLGADPPESREIVFLISYPIRYQINSGYLDNSPIDPYSNRYYYSEHKIDDIP